MTTKQLKPKKNSDSTHGSNGRNGLPRLADIVINDHVCIPGWVTDLNSFRRWACSDNAPESGRFSWLEDTLWVEVQSELLDHLTEAAVARMRSKALAPIRQTRFADQPSGDVLIDELVRIPRQIYDVDSFCRWAFSDAYPDHGRFAFLAGKLWVDLGMETDFHSQIKTVITIVLGSIVLKEALGRFYADGMLLTNRALGLANEPDAMFVSHARLEKGHAALKQGDKSTDLTGSADMALEVVSKSSLKKDKVASAELYAKAGISEYWLVDSTIDSPELVIMRLKGGRYVTARKHDGWVKSHVYGRSFRLTSKKDANGLSHFNLETK